METRWSRRVVPFTPGPSSPWTVKYEGPNCLYHNAPGQLEPRTRQCATGVPLFLFERSLLGQDAARYHVFSL